MKYQTETKAKHTPGPWHINTLEVNPHTIHAACGCVAEAHRGSLDCLSVYEQEANARLIAAAPELLEALKACALIMERIDDSRLHHADRGPFTGALIEARNAISKAEGAK